MVYCRIHWSFVRIYGDLRPWPRGRFLLQALHRVASLVALQARFSALGVDFQLWLPLDSNHGGGVALQIL